MRVRIPFRRHTLATKELIVAEKSSYTREPAHFVGYSHALQPLVVTTAQRGVFFGYGVPTAVAGTVRLERARMCLYWSDATKGVVGLAVRGPAHGSRVGPAALAITLTGVTSIMEATSEAAAAWEQELWS